MLSLHQAVHRLRTHHDIYCSYCGLRTLTLANRGARYFERGRTILVSQSDFDEWALSLDRNAPPRLLSVSFEEFTYGLGGQAPIDIT